MPSIATTRVFLLRPFDRSALLCGACGVHAAVAPVPWKTREQHPAIPSRSTALVDASHASSTQAYPVWHPTAPLHCHCCAHRRRHSHPPLHCHHPSAQCSPSEILLEIAFVARQYDLKALQVKPAAASLCCCDAKESPSAGSAFSSGVGGDTSPPAPSSLPDAPLSAPSAATNDLSPFDRLRRVTIGASMSTAVVEYSWTGAAACTGSAGLVIASNCGRGGCRTLPPRDARPFAVLTGGAVSGGASSSSTWSITIAIGGASALDLLRSAPRTEGAVSGASPGVDTGGSLNECRLERRPPRLASPGGGAAASWCCCCNGAGGFATGAMYGAVDWASAASSWPSSDSPYCVSSNGAPS
eukprot:Opistho-2@7846